jgi:gliding motility-associated-like protein
MKKLLPLSLILCLFFLFTEESSASHVAAGQTDVVHNDTGWVPCTFPDKYIVTALFFRECSGIDAPGSIQLIVKSTCFGSTTYTLDPFVDFLPNGDTLGGGGPAGGDLCIKGDDVPCTEQYAYRYYNPDGTFNIELPGPCADWSFSWSVNARPGNNENVNGGTFYVETTLDNSRPCDTVVTGANGIPPNDSCFNTTSYNNSAIFNNQAPIETFCVGKSYKYFIGATDPDGDSLAYRIINPLSGPGTPVGFTAGYSINDPLPVVNRPVQFDNKNGILEFTPAQAFVGSFAYVAEEWRDSCFIDSVFVNGDSVAMIRSKKVLVGETARDSRIIFGTDCITDLPIFGNDPNDLNAPIDPNNPPLFTGGIEVNCAATKFNVRMSVALQCNTLEPYGTDFRLVQGDPENPTAIYAIDTAYATDCKDNAFFTFSIELFEPIGPGDYKLFFKTGDDFNTLQTKCGIDVPEFTFINVTVIDNFTFDLDFESIALCRPADPAAIAIANFDDASFYAWSYKGVPIGGDSAQVQVVDSHGVWTVEVNVKGCADSDNFFVDITKNKPVEVPDYYLCPEEIDTLLIRLDTVFQGSNHTWYWLNDKTNDFEIVSTQQNLIAGSFIRGGKFYSEVTINNVCTEEDTFIIDASDVIVNIGKDSTFCFGNEYWLYNTEKYDNPKEMSFQWFLDTVSIPGATNDSLFIFKKGEYKLEVTKRNLCSGSHTVRINIADTLAAPNPVCSKITFIDGQIRQRFYWETVEGADNYEVKELYTNGTSTDWIETNDPDGWGIHHFTFNPQAELLVRAVNNEIPDGASCQYSVSGKAEACEVIVKPSNVFTPNGDGINDFLEFDLIQVYPGSGLQVFNRWGKLIFEDSGYSNDWDGEDYEAGTYYYVLDVNDPTQGILKGYVTIIR